MKSQKYTWYDYTTRNRKVMTCILIIVVMIKGMFFYLPRIEQQSMRAFMIAYCIFCVIWNLGVVWKCYTRCEPDARIEIEKTDREFFSNRNTVKMDIWQCGIHTACLKPTTEFVVIQNGKQICILYDKTRWFSFKVLYNDRVRRDLEEIRRWLVL